MRGAKKSRKRNTEVRRLTIDEADTVCYIVANRGANTDAEGLAYYPRASH
jgi:hypothetical protein